MESHRCPVETGLEKGKRRCRETSFSRKDGSLHQENSNSQGKKQMNQEYLISRTCLGVVDGGEETMEDDSLMSVLKT